MKIEHNHLVTRVAENLRYEAALAQFSPALNAENAQPVISRAQQTLAVVSQRTDTLMRHLTDDEMGEVIYAALDMIADEAHLRASRAIKHKLTQQHLRAKREEKEKHEAALAARKNKRAHLRLV